MFINLVQQDIKFHLTLRIQKNNQFVYLRGGLNSGYFNGICSDISPYRDSNIYLYFKRAASY